MEKITKEITMKTLEQVINKLECYPVSPSTLPCSVSIVTVEDLNDALHYLKEYRSKQDTIAEQLAELKQKNDHVCKLAKTVCEEYARLCNRLAKEYRNEPLMWDELKTMVGKPVWVEYSGYTPHWEIVENIGAVRGSTGDFTGNFIETNKGVLHKNKQGTDWQAYRKERE